MDKNLCNIEILRCLLQLFIVTINVFAIKIFGYKSIVRTYRNRSNQTMIDYIFSVLSDKYLLAYHQDSFKVLMRGEIFLIVLMEHKHLRWCIIYIALKMSQYKKKQQLNHVEVSLIIYFWASFHSLQHFLIYMNEASINQILRKMQLQVCYLHKNPNCVKNMYQNGNSIIVSFISFR